MVDIETDAVVTEDLSMPHSPRPFNGQLWVLDSGRGYLCRVDRDSEARSAKLFRDLRWYFAKVRDDAYDRAKVAAGK